MELIILGAMKEPLEGEGFERWIDSFPIHRADAQIAAGQRR
jgi:hypothetical protein